MRDVGGAALLHLYRHSLQSCHCGCSLCIVALSIYALRDRVPMMRCCTEIPKRECRTSQNRVKTVDEYDAEWTEGCRNDATGVT